LIDRLIIAKRPAMLCLGTSSTIKPYRNEESGTTRATTFHYHWKNMEIL